VKGKDPRVALAEWLTAKDNPLFRQNMANRVWAHFFGRGIVDPVDDVRISNPPSNKELLEALGQHLADHDFDLKLLIRDICNSRTYQLSSDTNGTNRDDAQMFSHAHLRRLRADVLLDSIAQVTKTSTSFNEEPAGIRATQLYEGSRRSGSYFLKTFGLSQRDSVNVSETRTEPTLAQALHLVNGDTIQGKIDKSPVIQEMLSMKKKPEEIIDELFVRAVSRKPSELEKKKLLALVQATPTDRKAYDDVFWALLNSTEFSFNH
jgi:hypothetical protein